MSDDQKYLELVQAHGALLDAHERLKKDLEASLAEQAKLRKLATQAMTKHQEAKAQIEELQNAAQHEASHVAATVKALRTKVAELKETHDLEDRAWRQHDDAVERLLRRVEELENARAVNMLGSFSHKHTTTTTVTRSSSAYDDVEDDLRTFAANYVGKKS